MYHFIARRAFFQALATFREHAKFGVSFDGAEKKVSLRGLLEKVQNGADFVNLNLRGFDLTTEPCLPQPKSTEDITLIALFSLLSICLTSCIVDAYLSRLRTRICDFFFPVRARERALFLYKTIHSGRQLRRIKSGMFS